MRRLVSSAIRLASTCRSCPSNADRPPNRLLLISQQSNLFQVRKMSAERNVDLTYDEILDLKAKDQIVLVDVRENKEIQETGKLPGSIHIPLGELQQALKISADEFKAKYEGADQPTNSSELVFSCRGGMRSRKAMAAAQEVGFTNVRHYAGGWLDWEEKTKK